VSGTVFFSVAALFGAVMNAGEDEAAEQLLNEGNYKSKIFFRENSLLYSRLNGNVVTAKMEK
jgi:hypothetical protein